MQWFKVLGMILDTVQVLLRKVMTSLTDKWYFLTSSSATSESSATLLADSISQALSSASSDSISGNHEWISSETKQ